MFRILLVNPKYPIPHPPLGLGYLSSYLKRYLETPVDVRVFDETVDKDLSGVISGFQPDLVGISIVTPTFRRTVSLCEQVRAATTATIVAGGVHITTLPDCITQGPFDVGVMGEGESTFLELVQHYLKTGKITSPHIAGIVYQDNGRLVRTPPRPLIKDIDTIPPPDRDLFDMKHYSGPGRMVHGVYAKGTSMMPSRGCPYGTCDFCSSSLMWGESVRLFSPRYVADELQSVVDEYGLNFIVFLDDNFTTRLKWLEELCVLLEERGLTQRIRFDCESIPAFMTDAKAALLKRMGCVRIEFGFESGCDRVLKHLKCGKSRLEYHERAIDTCHRHGIAVLGNMICGYIDETPEELEESINWFRRQPIDFVAPHLYTPYPGTPAWDKCVALGIVDPDDIDEGTFHTHKASRNVVVNTVFPPGELERRYRAIGEEFRRRNKVMVFDHGLSQEERVTLYAKASELPGPTVETKSGCALPHAIDLSPTV
ncbi:MAG: radical SAM protein [Phycisphaerae bacterium]